jgi:hypothetical protein
MKRLFLAAVSTLVALVLPGCLQSETTIHLNKDGSGTLVEQTLLGMQMIEMFDSMAAGFGGGANKKDPVAEMFSAEKAKAKAATLGAGVTFEKSEPLSLKTGKGARVTYRFANINTLTISPTDNMKNLSPMGGQAPSPAKQKPLGFAYSGGTLVITMPEPKKADDDMPKPLDAPDGGPEAEAMMKQMLGDMKVSLQLVVEPGIAETDATYRAGSTITLMQMDMGKLLEKPDSLKKLQSAPKGDPAAAIELFKGIDGMKMETKKTVTVKLN